jgi:hypothetical protein
VLLWLVAVPAAAALGVLGLRSAGADGGASAVISPGQALALAAAASPSATPSATPTQTPSPSASPAASPVVERRVPGAVLGLRCSSAGQPALVWAVPDAGWFVEGAELEDGRLVVRLESGRDEVRVSVTCEAGLPVVVGAQRRDD